MKAIAILAHLMDSQGVLGKETIERIRSAVQRDKTEDFLTSGWDYRSDSNIKIGDSVAEYLCTKCGVSEQRIRTDTNSRDTVGDAFYIRKNLVIPLGIKTLVVVTSDYHVKRTDVIFKNFLLPEVEVETIGACSGLVGDYNIKRHENGSLVAFIKTFKGVNFSSEQEVVAVLQSKHPYYNGDVYEKIRSS